MNKLTTPEWDKMGKDKNQECDSLTLFTCQTNPILSNHSFRRFCWLLFYWPPLPYDTRKRSANVLFLIRSSTFSTYRPLFLSFSTFFSFWLCLLLCLGTKQSRLKTNRPSFWISMIRSKQRNFNTHSSIYFFLFLFDFALTYNFWNILFKITKNLETMLNPKAKLIEEKKKKVLSLFFWAPPKERKLINFHKKKRKRKK